MDALVNLSINQEAAKQKARQTAADFLDTVCKQEPYLYNLDHFLYENDPQKSLLYWLENYEDLSRLKSLQDVVLLLNRTISEIDHLINSQLNLIIHAAAFKKLEASWRGLWYLVVQADGNRNIKIRVLDVAWSEICRDLEKALDVEQSLLFHKIYSEEYGTPGGEPYGVIIGDYEISHKRSLKHPDDDMAALAGLSQIAAASFSPFIAGASSELFGLDDFSTLGMPINLQSIFGQQEYIRWRALREKPDSRFVGLTLPKVLLRSPYRTTPGSYKGLFYFDQPASVKGQSTSLWGNACYAFGGILLREFASVGWFGHIRGVPRDQIGGGLVTNLIAQSFATDGEGIAKKPVVDVIITDTQERELSDLGLIPLCHCYDTSYAAFYSNQSVQLPGNRISKADEANAKLSAMLQHVLCASRIAHYLKVMIRDKIGSFITAQDCENFLMDWLFRYTTGRDDLDWEEQARYPLRQARVNVQENMDKPGQYFCIIHLVPHYQLDQMVSELELVTELMSAR